MNGKLIDTNVIIRFFKGETELFSLFDDMEQLYVSSISVGELMYGAELSKKSDFNRQNYFCFCEQMKILQPDLEVAKMYGKIKSNLKAKGRPIPENDIWIAATALATDLELVTADSDFENVSGLCMVKM
ncbi:MAG: type II toxin-antitoxin system VapC family toxin [Treponema sp.]|uniref:type II toxin-antitoxin system VapC family toxin n=1 Tax=Treponema sp. TaxID=166 RepID=UPI002A91A64A|nr:type II toxin-antitoxin system VapC family toxin [Treponema sp.]MDY6396146.1 type II toxin-antitoxin system VapC family toxin [Treponema sp.]